MEKLVPEIMDKSQDEITLALGDAGPGLRPMHILLNPHPEGFLC